MDHPMYERVFEFGPVDIVIAAYRKMRVMSGSRLLPDEVLHVSDIRDVFCIRDGYSDIRQEPLKMMQLNS